ncbi:MAG: hypothetical protein NT059_09420 [Planctomycetota bacterium]|nr:hypothetical protein [Planctomycetota bacterium]
MVVIIAVHARTAPLDCRATMWPQPAAAGMARGELAAHLGIQKGDHLHVLVTPRGIELSPFDPALDEQLTIGRSVMKRYRSALRKLAE